MKTRAPDMIMVTISGPSIRGDDVMTTKHSAAQNRVSRMHWVFVSGFRIADFFRNEFIRKRVGKICSLERKPCQLVKLMLRHIMINILFSFCQLWRQYML